MQWIIRQKMCIIYESCHKHSHEENHNENRFERQCWSSIWIWTVSGARMSNAMKYLLRRLLTSPCLGRLRNAHHTPKNQTEYEREKNALCVQFDAVVR